MKDVRPRDRRRRRTVLAPLRATVADPSNRQHASCPVKPQPHRRHPGREPPARIRLSPVELRHLPPDPDQGDETRRIPVSRRSRNGVPRRRRYRGREPAARSLAPTTAPSPSLRSRPSQECRCRIWCFASTPSIVAEQRERTRADARAGLALRMARDSQLAVAVGQTRVVARSCRPLTRAISGPGGNPPGTALDCREAAFHDVDLGTPGACCSFSTRPNLCPTATATSRAAVPNGAHAGCYRNRAELGQSGLAYVPAPLLPGGRPLLCGWGQLPKERAVLGVERADGRPGNSGEPSRPGRLRGGGKRCPSYNRRTGGRSSGSRSGS